MSESIRHIDARIMLGHGDWTKPGQPVSVDAALAAMDHFGIHEAFVVDSLSETGDAQQANRLIIEKTRPHARLHPVWVVLPPQTGELPPPAEMVERMRTQAVAAAWLSYGAFDIPLEEWCLGPLFAPLEEARVPVFLCPTDRRVGERDDATDWSGVVRLCKGFPELPVIVTESRIYKSQRALCAALDACENLHVDVSALWLHHFIEFLCKRFGARRLVRGSQLPYRTPGATLMQLDYSDISDEDKALIAGGNLRRLAAWNPSMRFGAEDVAFPEPTDALHRAALSCESLSGEAFYDCHGHIGWSNQRHVISEPAEELVSEMDRLGLRTCCLFSWIAQGDIVRANDRAYAAAERFPERFAAFTALNPNHGEEEMRAELERGRQRGAVGIKLVSSIHGYPADGPLIELACRFAHEHRLFILNHVWGPAELMRGLCSRYPNACFITGHSERSFPALVRQFDNLYICSCPFLAWGQTEEYVRLYGAERILFGSDLLDLPIAWGLGPVSYARVTEAEKRLILGENLRRLMQTYGRR